MNDDSPNGRTAMDDFFYAIRLDSIFWFIQTWDVLQLREVKIPCLSPAMNDRLVCKAPNRGFCFSFYSLIDITHLWVTHTSAGFIPARYRQRIDSNFIKIIQAWKRKFRNRKIGRSSIVIRQSENDVLRFTERPNCDGPFWYNQAIVFVSDFYFTVSSKKVKGYNSRPLKGAEARKSRGGWSSEFWIKSNINYLTSNTLPFIPHCPFKGEHPLNKLRLF
jgi:hypothetical protein